MTFLLTDVEGSTRLWERQPAVMRQALARHDELAAEAIGATGGRVVKPRGEGDSIFAVFGDAADAAAGAVEFQRALEQEAWPEGCALRTRAALHTGPAEVREGDYYGPTVNRAARLRAIGHGRQVLLSHATYEAIDGRVPGELEIRDLGVHRLKDLREPEHVRQLYWPGLAEEFPPLASLHPHLTNLPSHGSAFVDRVDEVAEVERLLEAGRLVTLVGPAGVGKTRLATHVGAEVLDRFDDGVWHVDVAPLADGTGVVSATAAVLGARDDRRRATLETLVAHLSGRTALLLLDNCELLREDCAELVRLVLAGCAECSVLATGREPLGVRDEIAWEVPPLGAAAAGELYANRAAGAGQAPTADAQTVQAICRQLAGLPLAIELAAAHGLAADGPAVEPLLDGALETLWDDERAALRRLSVFSGAFSLDAAGYVLGEGLPAAKTLDSLVRRALVAYDPAAPEAPYRLAPAVRRYAARRLDDAGEAHAAAAAHAGWHLEAAESGTLPDDALHHDVPRALAWSSREQPEHARRLSGALDPAARGQVLAAAGRLAIMAGDEEHGRELLAEAATLSPASPS